MTAYKSFFTILLLQVLAAGSLCAQTEVASFLPGVTTDGVSYFLPKTRLHLAIEATQVTHTPGEYAPYADTFLRIGDVPQTAREAWTINTLSVTPYGVADPAKAFTIRLKPKTSAPLVTLTADGCLLAINAEALQPEALSQPSVKKVGNNALNAANYKTPEILAATSPRKAAELTAEEIYDIRENRSMLLKGQADFMPKDGAQLKLMLDNLAEQEAALLQLFQGTADTTKHVITLDVEPVNFDGNPQALFRFSNEKGFLEPGSPEGMLYTISFTDENTLPAVPVEAAAKASKKEIEDMRYCMSGNARALIATSDGNVIWQQSMPFGQIGRIEHLGGDLFNKKSTTHVYLHPTTGSILKLDAAPETK